MSSKEFMRSFTRPDLLQPVKLKSTVKYHSPDVLKYAELLSHNT